MVFGFGSSAGPPTVMNNVLTPEQLQGAVDQFQNYMGGFNELSGTPFAGPGGTQVTNSRELSASEQKVRAYTQYLVQNKGVSPQEAQRRANEIVAKKKLKFSDDKGFKQWIKGGNAPGLKARKGKIKSTGPQFEGGQVQTSPESQALLDLARGLSGESLQAARGLPSMFANETAQALASRQGIRNNIMDFAGQNLNEQGLTEQNELDLQAIEDQIFNKFGDVFSDTMQGATGNLIDSGFNSSSLAGDALQDGAYNTQSRFLTDAAASLANTRQGLIDSNVNNNLKNLSGLTSAFNTVGANSGIGAVTGGAINPGSLGLFTDPQSAQLAATLKQQDLMNMQRNQFALSDLATKPVTLFGDTGAGGMNAAGGVSGALSGAKSGAAFGPWGAAIGGLIGGGAGLFS